MSGIIATDRWFPFARPRPRIEVRLLCLPRFWRRRVHIPRAFCLPIMVIMAPTGLVAGCSRNPEMDNMKMFSDHLCVVTISAALPGR